MSAFNVKVGSSKGDKPMSSMGIADVAIVTEVPAGHKVPLGTVVVSVASNHYGFLGTGTWASNPEGYRVRRLEPGETVTITGV